MKRALRRLAEGLPTSSMTSMNVAGIPITLWWDAWLHCQKWEYGKPYRISWPDGGAYINQPYWVVQMFDWIDQVVQQVLSRH